MAMAIPGFAGEDQRTAGSCGRRARSAASARQRGVSVPNSSTRRVAGHVRSAHIEYAGRARFLPLQELGVQVVEFDLEFLACSIREFGEGRTLEADRVPALIEDPFVSPAAVASELLAFRPVLELG